MSAHSSTARRWRLPESFSQLPAFLLYRMDTFTDYEVAEGNPYFQSVDGVLFFKDGKTLVAYPCGRTRRTYTMPEGTETVGAAAFYAMCYLEEVVLADSPRSIGGCAFADSQALQQVEIPDGVTDIGVYAFNECWMLKQVKLPASLREISNELLLCSGLEGTLVIPGGG